MNTFLQHLSDPEYMHILLNPLPVYGLAVAVLALAIALLWRTRSARLIALALVLFTAASAGPVYYYGEAGYDRVKSMSDPAGEQWLDEHMRRGEETIVAFYVTAGLAALAIFAEFKSKRVAVPFAILTLLFAVAALGMGAWVAYAGGHVRHKEFRFEAPPQKAAEQQLHEQ